MTSILAGAIAVLLAIMAALWWRLDAETTRAASLDAALNTAVAANEASQSTITALAAEMLANDRDAVEALRRERAAKAKERAAAAELERLKNENQDLRTYLDSPIHGGVAGWLWMDVQARGGDGDAGGSGVSAGRSAGADAQAGASVVTHQSGWTWAFLTDMALDSCNDDKAAIRAWKSRHMGVGSR